MFFTVKYVNRPGPQSSGKFGSIVSPDGTKVYVPIELLDQFKNGTSVEVATEEKTWGGNPVIVATSGPGGMPQRQRYGGGYQGTNQASAAQRGNTGFQPQVIQGGAGRAAQSSSDKDPRQIFVTGVVGRAMGGGKFTASEIAILTQAACDAYDRIVTAPPRQHADPYVGQNEPIGDPQDPGPELQ